MSPTTLSGPGPEIIIVELDQPGLRATAEQDSAVKAQLGDRFAFINTEEVPASWCLVTGEARDPAISRATERPEASETLTYRLTYYSYTNNVAVHVWLNDQQISSIQPDTLKGYQPEEGDEEITAAIELARADQRIAQEVQTLHGHAF